MTEQDIKRILFGAKFLLGENGKNWAHGNPMNNSFLLEKHCILSAIGLSMEKLYIENIYENREIILIYLRSVLKDLGYEHLNPNEFNDDSKTTWANVEEFMQVAIDRIKPLKV